MVERFTYPPEMLPSPPKGEEAEVFVRHPDTLRETVIWRDGKFVRPAIRKGEAAPTVPKTIG